MYRRRPLSTKGRYLAYVLIAFMPALSGCLWQSFHLKGEIDAEGPVEEEQADSPSQDRV